MKVTIDILEITSPDPYSVEMNIIPDKTFEDEEPRETVNLSKEEVFELATHLLTIYKNMKS